MPNKNVASIAPARVLICAFAQRPKAADPPVLLIKATIMPRITRKIKIPALEETAPINHSFIMTSIVFRGLKEVASKPPTRIPINREE